MTKQPYQFRARDWIPFKGQDEYERRVLEIYGNLYELSRNSPEAYRRANLLGVYNAINLVGLLGLASMAVPSIILAIDRIIE